MVLLLISSTLFATTEHLSLTGVANGTHFYYCSTVDTVIVHKPDGTGTGVWYPNGGNPYQLGDSVIITQSSPSFWEFSDGFTTITFYIHFVSIPPSLPWSMGLEQKCHEDGIIIDAQPGNTQPDFVYEWSLNGSPLTQTGQSIYVIDEGLYAVTITGACGQEMDYIDIVNYGSPMPYLGQDILTCDGNVVTLDPGGPFVSYAWTGGSTDPTLDVTTAGTYIVTVIDTNSCTATDTIVVDFIINQGAEIALVTIDTINGNNRVTWEVLDPLYHQQVVVYREVSTNVYDSIGSAPYHDGEWVDIVNSVNQSWRYKIATVDTCGNESPLSLYHQSISIATVPLVPSGYRIEWTEYLIEGAKSVANYHVFAIQGLGQQWNPHLLSTVTGNVTSYNIPSVNDSMFVVGAEIGGQKTTTPLALSNVVDNPLISSTQTPAIIANMIALYPNPSSGVFFVEGGERMEIYNNLGQLILSESIQSKKEITLPVAGIYTVRVYDDREQVVSSQKIIIY